MTNPEWVEILQDALPLQEKEERRQTGIWLGFEWFEVQANPQTLKKMVTLKLLDITFSSHSSTHYKVADPALVREAILVISEPASEPQHEMPADIFESIVGYPDVQTLLDYHRAVLGRSKRYFLTLSRTDLDRELDEPWFQPLPKVGVRLVSILEDSLLHVGQAAYVRGLREGKGWQSY